MRLPAVAIAAALASGIVLGLHPAVARNAASLILLSTSFVTIAVLVLTGIFLVTLGRLFLAASASLLSWVLLGFLGVCIAEQPRRADHVISLRSEEHTSELQSHLNLVCRLLLEKKKDRIRSL